MERERENQIIFCWDLLGSFIIMYPSISCTVAPASCATIHKIKKPGHPEQALFE